MKASFLFGFGFLYAVLALPAELDACGRHGIGILAAYSARDRRHTVVRQPDRSSS